MTDGVHTPPSRAFCIKKYKSLPVRSYTYVSYSLPANLIPTCLAVGRFVDELGDVGLFISLRGPVGGLRYWHAADTMSPGGQGDSLRKFGLPKGLQARGGLLFEGRDGHMTRHEGG